MTSAGARFAGRRELRRRLRPSPGAWFPLGHLPPWPPALALWRRLSGAAPPPYLLGRRLCLPNTDLARHVLVTGLTGAHKTTALTLPVLLDAARAGVSAVAFDLKYGERDSLAGAAPEWWRQGRDVIVFAPSDSSSLRWNPLAVCRSLGDAYEFALHLFPDESAESPDFGYWTGAERHVCAALTWALVTDGGARSVARLRALAEAGPDAVASYVHGHRRAAVIAEHLGAYGAMLPKDRAGILQGIAGRLESWSDERVSAATADPRGAGSWDEITLARLRREPTLLLIGVPQAALPRLRSLCQLLMRMLAAQMLRPRGQDEPVPVVYVLEELPAWGPLPGLADLLATFRSREVAIVATVQSEAQGESVYGASGWAAIAANFVTKIYFPSLADPDAERLSRALGTTTVAQVSRGRGWSGRGRQETEQTRMIDVPLRRPEALQGVGAMEDEITVRCSGLPPARLWCPPYHLRPSYARLVPETAPSTVEIAVRHHLRSRERDGRRRNHGSSHLGPCPAVSAEPIVDAPIVTAPRVATSAASAPAAEVRSTDRGRTAPDDDFGVFVEAVLSSSDGGISPRIVCRDDRLIEMRIRPTLAFRLLGGGDKAQTVIRKWAARRWVRQVRPVFVIERAAFDTLDPELRRRLTALCGTARVFSSSGDRPA
jgi:type IV secretory pathway TraG/TraD family ATPase VirD4